MLWKTGALQSVSSLCAWEGMNPGYNHTLETSIAGCGSQGCGSFTPSLAGSPHSSLFQKGALSSASLPIPTPGVALQKAIPFFMWVQ